MKTRCWRIMKKAEFALIGDSHAGAIGKAAREAGLGFEGGPLGSAREFYGGFFEAVESGVSFKSPDTEEMHRELCTLLKVGNLCDVDIPILSTIGSGFHVPATSALWEVFQGTPGCFEAQFQESGLFDEICQKLMAPMLDFHRCLIERSASIYFVLPPQRVPETSSSVVLQLFQTRAADALSATGCKIIDTRLVTSDSDGWQLREYCKDNDPLHANTAFGVEILKAAGYLP